MSALYEDKFMRVLLMFDVPTKTKKGAKVCDKIPQCTHQTGLFYDAI